MEIILPIIYFLVFWIISTVVTVFDKTRAKNGGRRVSEATLLLLGALGGAGAMLATMKTIRHKTKKAKFMVTLPVFFVAHLILFGWYLNYILVIV